MSNNSPYIFALNNMFREYKDYTLEDKGIDYNTIGDISPVSGYEPNFEPFKWNNTYAQYNHNCYAYVLNTLAPKRNGKPQPGYFSNFPPIEEKDYNCLAFYERLRKDIPSLYLASFDEKCKKGYYKGFIALDKRRKIKIIIFIDKISQGIGRTNLEEKKQLIMMRRKIR